MDPSSVFLAFSVNVMKAKRDDTKNYTNKNLSATKKLSLESNHNVNPMSYYLEKSWYYFVSYNNVEENISISPSLSLFLMLNMKKKKQSVL